MRSEWRFSQTVVRRCRGDIAQQGSLVHAIATIAGENHMLRLNTEPTIERMPALPIIQGFDMPMLGEMASCIDPTAMRGVDLDNQIGFATVITSDLVKEPTTTSMCLSDAILRKDPDPCNLPLISIANSHPGEMTVWQHRSYWAAWCPER